MRNEIAVMEWEWEGEWERIGLMEAGGWADEVTGGQWEM